MTTPDTPTAPRRLRILDVEEIEALYGRLRFTDDERAAYFALTPPEQGLVQVLRTLSTQVAFILQLGYFKAKQRFFSFTFDEVADEVQYILAQSLSVHGRVTLEPPHRRTLVTQHQIILDRFGYRLCTVAERRCLKERAAQVVRLSSKPVYVCRDLLQYLADQRIVAPGYTLLQDLVAEAVTAEEARLQAILRAHMEAHECALLDSLYADTPEMHPITLLKREPKDFSRGEMRAEIARRDQLQPLAHLAGRLLPHLGISPEGIRYYASLVTFYTVSRLKRLDPWTVYLYLLCFASHRYQRLHDHLLTCFIHLVKQYVDEAKEVAKEQVAAERRAHHHDLPKAGQVLKLFTSDAYGEDTLFQTVQAQAFHILARPRLEQVADQMTETADSDETAKEWAHATVLARRFKPRLRPLLRAIEIVAAQRNAPILEAMAFLTSLFEKDRPLSQVRAAAFPTRVIPKRLRRYLYDRTAAGPKRPLADQYEFLVYRLLRHGLERHRSRPRWRPPMPVDFLTQEQERCYGRFAGEPTPLQLDQSFYLDDHDRALVAERRGDHNRLGYSLQLTTVRYLGTFLADPTAVPPGVITHLAAQLGIADTSCLLSYGTREPTHRAHAGEIQRRYGYRDVVDPATHFHLVRWLYARAWVTAERPSLLFDLATAHLVERKVLLPSVTVLARLVARVRDRVAERLWQTLARAPTPEQRAGLERLVIALPDARQTPLDRLRHGPTRANAGALVGALNRLREIRALDVGALDLTRIPPGRLAALARHAATSWAATVTRMTPERRVATLLAFARVYEARAQDDALDILDSMIAALLARVEREGDRARLRALRDLDVAALILRDACPALTCPMRCWRSRRTLASPTRSPTSVRATRASLTSRRAFAPC